MSSQQYKSRFKTSYALSAVKKHDFPIEIKDHILHKKKFK